MKTLLAICLIAFTASCSTARPIMQGCKKLPLQDRDWSECEKQVA